MREGGCNEMASRTWSTTTSRWNCDIQGMGAASQNLASSDGGPLGLKTLVNACHAKGLAVFLDVVYNSLGPEGNYLSEYGPYFTDRCTTPWGQAVNFTLLTKEHDGYYQDFGHLSPLRTAITDGFVYHGQPSPYRGRTHGTVSGHLPGERFVIDSQNHDQVGNRADEERLSTLAPFPALKLAAGLVLGAPNIPLTFTPFAFALYWWNPEAVE